MGRTRRARNLSGANGSAKLREAGCLRAPRFEGLLRRFFVNHGKIMLRVLEICTKLPVLGDRINTLRVRLLGGPTPLIEAHGNKMYVDARDSSVSAELISTNGRYEEYTAALWMEMAKPGMVVVDVGAHFGYYTLMAARSVGETGVVYAFEPEPHNFALLERNVELNGFSNVRLINKAVSAVTGRSRFYVDRFNLGAHTLSSRNIVVGGGEIDIETVSLDDFLDGVGVATVDLMKIDVQGAEGLVVDGSPETLSGSDVKVILEIWPFGLRSTGYKPAEFVKRLHELGFGFKRIDGGKGCLKPLGLSAMIRLCNRTVRKYAYYNVLVEKRNRGHHFAGTVT